MHKSLRPATNLLLIAITASVVVVAVLLAPSPKMLPMIGAGALFGNILGFLQLRGISEAQSQLLVATTAPDVRSALMTSKAGRAAIRGLWLCAFLLVILSMLLKTPPMGVVAGFAALALFRDLLALKGCYQLQQASGQGKTKRGRS